ncbi:MFS transporter [Streptomyces sp. SID3343]|uniref:MFS transporter n=1 Tax=Streptomyces sp. SID3343 TaxID=2690260 RepID=UPI00136BB20B|nr:MFS transporter [Streptomyces sp. SID3343]MYW03952.1 MFS transporter [Streptomyces sp. SID3343]
MPATPVGAPPPRPAHKDPRVLAWLGAYTVSLMGDQIWYIALSWTAVRAGDAGEAGLVLAAGSLPRALLMLPGGAIADRYGPRRVLIGSDTVRCAVMIVAAFAVVSSSPAVWLLVVIALVFGAVDALFMPAVGALPARLTTREQLVRVQGMRALAQRVATVASAPVAGAVLAWGDAQLAFLVDAVLFALSLALLWRLRPGPAPEAETGDDTPELGLRAGLRYVAGHRLLRLLLVTTALMELGFAVPMNIGIVLLADDAGWGPGGMGLVLGAWGLGAAAGALALAVLGHVPRRGFVLPAGMAAMAASLIGIGYAPGLAAAIGCGAALGVSTGIVGSSLNALVQTASAPSALGRVTALQLLFGVGLIPLLYPVAGVAASAFGPATVFAAGGTTVFVGVVVACVSGPFDPVRTASGHGRIPVPQQSSDT